MLLALDDDVEAVSGRAKEHECFESGVIDFFASEPEVDAASREKKMRNATFPVGFGGTTYS